ncbi:ALK tyrosine kinase receptor-like isoform X2 [Argopecten irradians]|uniref:ALK tyrosine kinase receptor-like isoform X2 n=1 Tax=Argopecten irradians TaxID=31199 RepID=UPI00371A75C5
MLLVVVYAGLLIWLLCTPVNSRLCDFNSNDCQWKIQQSDTPKKGTPSPLKEFVLSTRQQVDKLGVNGSVLDINPLLPKGNDHVRLVGKKKRSQLEGSVEVNKNGKWGTVCDFRWNDTDASVVCRTLGYSGGRAYQGAHFGRGTGMAGLMEGVQCKGIESSILDCKDKRSTTSCSHDEDAGVSCGGDTFALLSSTDSRTSHSEVPDEKIKGVIQSVWYKAGTKQRLMASFYTILYGSECTLTMSMCTQTRTRHIHTFNSSSTKGWTLERVNFTLQTSEEFYLQLHGHILSANSFIVLDKINLEELTDQGDLAVEICALSEFDCGAGVCIPAHKRCNLVVDCPDNSKYSDEDSCGSLPDEMMCAFENSTCGWHNVGNGKDFTWIHKISVSGQGYVRAYAPNVALHLDNAVLESATYARPPPQVFDPSSPYFNMCKLRFHLIISSTILNLKMTSFCDGVQGSKTLLYKFGGDKTNWEYVVVPLADPKGSYHLQFNVCGNGIYPNVQIANISLSEECFTLQGMAAVGNITVEPETCDLITTTPVLINNTTSEDRASNRTTRYEFKPCNAMGPEGPTQVKCDESYKSTPIKVEVIAEGQMKGIQIWTVPEDGTYLITAIGAAGGVGVKSDMNSKLMGSYVSGRYNLTAGDLLYIVVGQEGTNACSSQMVSDKVNDICREGKPATENEEEFFAENGGGGGGGGGASFVFKKDSITDELIPLIVAGGGGGLAYRSNSSHNSYQGVMLDTGPPRCGFTNPNGAGGGGGSVSCNTTAAFPQAGQSLLQGARGGSSCNKSIVSLNWNTPGGFGGGGGACASGGGGGGYSGGNVSLQDALEHSGGRGTSYYHPDTQTPEILPGVGDGYGLVEVTLLMNCRCQYWCNITDFDKKKYTCKCKDEQQLAPDQHHCVEPDKDAQKTVENDGLELHYIVVIALGATFMLVIVSSTMGCLYRQHQKHKQSNITMELGQRTNRQYTVNTSTHNGTIQPRTALPMGMMAEYNPNYDFVGAKYPEKHLPELNRHKLRLTRALGRGAFGEVYKGYLAGVPHMTEELPVAVKTLPVYSTEESEMEFLMEAMIMSKFSHPNIVKLLGVCFESHPRYIILELLEGGDLKTFLRESRPKPGAVSSSLTVADLLKLSIDIAKGCQHLEECHFIHRDIAARNCLLTCKNGDRMAKIADFGMARDIYRSDYYKKGGKAMLPIKWMPPEAFLDGLFTTKTDVWSFGILLWEIFSMGYMPYPGRTNQDVMQFVTTGGRLEPPDNCPLPIYQLMSICWAAIPETRPIFTELLEHLERCIQNPDVVNAQLPVFYPIPALEKVGTIIRPPDNLPPLAMQPLPEETFHLDVHESDSREPLLTPSSCHQEDKNCMFNDNNNGPNDNTALQCSSLVVRLTPPDSVSKSASESSTHQKSNQSLSDSSNAFCPDVLDATTQCGDAKPSKTNNMSVNNAHVKHLSAESSPLLSQDEASSQSSHDNDCNTRSRSESSSVKSTDRKMAASIFERLRKGSMKKS